MQGSDFLFYLTAGLLFFWPLAALIVLTGPVVAAITVAFLELAIVLSARFLPRRGFFSVRPRP